MAQCTDCGIQVPFLDNLCANCADTRSQSPADVDAAVQHVPTEGFQAYQLDTQHGIRATSVKTGFSWPAFFFGPIWAWIKGMVGIGFALLALNIFVNGVGTVLAASMGGPGAVLSILLSLGVAAWVGTNGNEWVRNSLIRKGYKPVESNATDASPAPPQLAPQPQPGPERQL